MREVRGDLWVHPADFRIITTNGSIRQDRCAVMGRGCAREAAQRYPMLPKELGAKLHFGNHVYLFPQYHLLTFPVKHEWQQDADLDLIAQSVQELKSMLDPKKRYLLPRPGCGNGRRDWNTEVRPLLMQLPDNVRVITYAKFTDTESV